MIIGITVLDLSFFLFRCVAGTIIFYQLNKFRINHCGFLVGLLGVDHIVKNTHVFIKLKTCYQNITVAVPLINNLIEILLINRFIYPAGDYKNTLSLWRKLSSFFH